MTKKEISRRYVGLSILAGGKAQPCAYAIYEITWSDFTTGIKYGNILKTVVGSEHLNGSKRTQKKSRKNLREDLYSSITAASVLLQEVEHACFELDKQIKEDI